MIYFNNDYSEGCHPKILEVLTRTNLEQTFGYGEDEYCARAAKKIRALCGREDAAVHFLVGGTQDQSDGDCGGTPASSGGTVCGQRPHQRPRNRRGGGNRS